MNQVEYSIKTDMTVRNIQSGLMGAGKPICVIQGDSMRFTNAIALGNGAFPKGCVVREQDLSKLNSGYFVIEVKSPGTIITDTEVYSLLDDAIKGGHYHLALKKAMECGDIYRQLVEQYAYQCLHSDERYSLNSIVTTYTILSPSGHLFFVVWRISPEGSSISCDGKCYELEASIVINDNNHVITWGTPVRDMNEEEWDKAKTDYSVGAL